jgi:hypothetical protein
LSADADGLRAFSILNILIVASFMVLEFSEHNALRFQWTAQPFGLASSSKNKIGRAMLARYSGIARGNFANPLAGNSYPANDRNEGEMQNIQLNQTNIVAIHDFNA